MIHFHLFKKILDLQRNSYQDHYKMTKQQNLFNILDRDHKINME
jgi:hypothetical protein